MKLSDIWESPAAGLAEHGHIVRVAAEGFDVVPHPLQRGDDVHDAHVAGILVFLAVGGQIWEYMMFHPRETNLSAIARGAGVNRHTAAKHYELIREMVGMDRRKNE